MSTDPQPMVVQLTDDQWDRLRVDLKVYLDRFEKALDKSTRRHEARALALAADGGKGDILLSREEAGWVLGIKPATVDAERRRHTISTAPHWKGRYSLRTILATYDLTAANDNG